MAARPPYKRRRTGGYDNGKRRQETLAAASATFNPFPPCLGWQPGRRMNEARQGNGGRGMKGHTQIFAIESGVARRGGDLIALPLFH
jgi:hypothetical protein